MTKHEHQKLESDLPAGLAKRHNGRWRGLGTCGLSSLPSSASPR
jgi:hypothetical protein